MRHLEASPRALVRLGVAGSVALVAASVLALSWPRLSDLVGDRRYTAEFSEAGGIRPGDEVVVSGVRVGQVNAVELDDDHVDVRFRIAEDTVRLGAETSAAVKAKTALGRKVLALRPAGAAALPDGGVIPVSRTTPAYDVTDALQHLTRNLTALDTTALARSFADLSQILDGAAPQVRPALDGVTRLSRAINDRDTELDALLRHTAGVTGVLAERDRQLSRLIDDGTALFTELHRRDRDLAELLANATALADQLRGLVADNRARLGPALDRLDALTDTLRANKDGIDRILGQAPVALRQIGEAVSAYPGLNLGQSNRFPPSGFLPGPARAAPR